LVTASQWLRVDRIYFEHHIAGTDKAPRSLRHTGHFSEQALAKIKATLAKRWLQITNPIATHSGSVQPNDFESAIITSSYHLERFLDFINLEFDEGDYSLVREHLRLPKFNVGKPASLDCHCEAHRDKRYSQTTNNSFSGTFSGRTWPKMVDCVKRLGLEAEPAQILANLSATAHFLGYQRTVTYL